MESLDDQFLEEINKNLGEIVQIMACTICDYFMKKPVAMFCACNHRACNQCVTMEAKYKDKDECPKCGTRFWICDRRPQTSFSKYMLLFKEFVNQMEKNKSPIAAELQDFVNQKIGTGDFKHLKLFNDPLDFDPDVPSEEDEPEDDLNVDNDNVSNDEEEEVVVTPSEELVASGVNENVNPDCNKTVIGPNNNNLTFFPEICSTSVKSRNPRNNFFAANSSAILFDASNKLVNDTVVNINKEDDIEEPEQHEKAKLTTLIESVPSRETSQDYNESTIIDDGDDEEMLEEAVEIKNSVVVIPDDMVESQEVPMFEEDDECLQDACNQIGGMSDNLNQSDNAELNPTQSQYHVIRPSITYSSKVTDRFDRVVNQPVEKPAAAQHNSKDPIQTYLDKTLDELNRSVNLSGMSRSESPELFSSDFYSDDSDLMTTAF